MALDEMEPDRSYLFGRLAAVADCVEIFAMSDSDNQHRQTNAIRYFSALQQHPAATWSVLEKRLQPYLTKRREKDEDRFREMLDEIISKFKPGEFAEKTALTPHFLEGYHNQRYELMNERKRGERK